MSFENDDEMPDIERVHLLVGAHRASYCTQAPNIANMEMLQSHKDKDGMYHMVLMAEHGLQYLVTKGDERLMMADPPICEAQVAGKPADVTRPKRPAGGKAKPLTEDDPLVRDCLALFHRTALDTCNEDYDVTLVDASLSVIDGLRVMTHVTMVGPAGIETKHRPSCLFEVSTDHTDASFLQKLERQPGDAEQEDPLPEEKAGLEATLELHVPLCDADETDGVPESEAEAFMFMAQYGMGELSLYKGYEYVRELLPMVTSKTFLLELGEATGAEDLRDRFTACFPADGGEVVRNQAQCGSCWAFASATTAMNELCVSGSGDSHALANAGDRYEVAVSQIMACNSDQRGCNGGHAPAASSALEQGVCKERDAPYACGQGDPQNHFEQASTTCSSPPWGRNCNIGGCAYSPWHFGGASAVNGEADMRNFISAGHTLYCTLSVYDDFMHLHAGSIYTGGGSMRGGHALACVGYGSQGGTDYWILQNSWGPSWADGGYGKIARGSNLAGIEEGAYYFRMWEDGGDIPPCLDGADTGLSAGGPNIPCDQANGRYGNLCAHPYYGPGVSNNCPASCGACPGGSGDAARWGSLLQTKQTKNSSKQAVIDHLGSIKSQADLIEILNAVGEQLRLAEKGDL